MDVISLGKALQAIKAIKELNDVIVAPQAEGRFPTVQARLDWIEGQANLLKVLGSKSINLEDGVFENMEYAAGALRLKAGKDVIGGLTDVARTGIPSASASYIRDQDQPISAIDGNSNTGWNAGKVDRSAWFQVDLKEIYEIKTVKIISYAMSSGDLYTSNDGVNFTKSVSLVPGENVLATPISTRYVRITNLNTDTQWTSIISLELYANAIIKSYAPVGSWTSPIIDLGEGYLNGKAIEVISSISAGTSALISVASSADGSVFGGFSPISGASIPQGRYLKVKVNLSGPPAPDVERKLDFNQSSAENTFAVDTFSIADGKLSLKTGIDLTTSKATLGAGVQFTAVIDRSQFKSIEKVSVK